MFWKTLGAEMVVRQNRRQALRAIDRTVQRMRRDKASVVISIEGRRSETGGLSAYKKGPIVLALNAGATIVPIVIRGTLSTNLFPLTTQERVRCGRMARGASA